jgi:hypothetical protein
MFVHICVCVFIAAFEAVTNGSITITYVPSHLYHILFEIMKVRLKIVKMCVCF